MDDKKEMKPPSIDEIMACLYPQKITCPVCDLEFTHYGVRKSKLRVDRTESDFRTRYHVLDPNHYEVQVCVNCGYAAMQAYFPKISDRQQDIIKAKISPGYFAPDYAPILSLEHVLERFDQALKCAEAIGAKDSQKAFIHLKKGWVYRDMAGKDEEEFKCMREAYTLLQNAFSTETFPLGAMDELTAKYMIAELARRIGHFTEALRWVSDVLVSRSVTHALKEKASLLKEAAREGKSN